MPTGRLSHSTTLRGCQVPRSRKRGHGLARLSPCGPSLILSVELPLDAFFGSTDQRRVFRRGTNGSNPSPSMSESRANLRSGLDDSVVMGNRSHRGSASATSSPADRHEVVHANALHDEELARAVGLAVHVMRRLRRYRAALARHEPIDVARRSRQSSGATALLAATIVQCRSIASAGYGSWPVSTRSMTLRAAPSAGSCSARSGKTGA